MMLKALSDYRRHCHCSRSNPAITVGMPKNQLEFHGKKENQNDCYQHCHKGQRNDKIRTCISPFAFRCLGASCLDHVALVERIAFRDLLSLLLSRFIFAV